MSFFSNLFSSDLSRELGMCALRSLMKVTGHSAPVKETDAPDIQCVKLTKDHSNVTQVVTYWTCVRVNQLLLLGVSNEIVDSIIEHDARFLSVLSDALDTQKTKKPAYDAWLFFNKDIKSTNFFELQQCARGSKVTKASFIIQAEY